MKSFKEVREATADDLKAVAGYITAAEQNVRDGDVGALINLLEKWSLWGQSLMIRHEARMDDYREAQEPSEALPSDQCGGGA